MNITKKTASRSKWKDLVRILLFVVLVTVTMTGTVLLTYARDNTNSTNVVLVLPWDKCLSSTDFTSHGKLHLDSNAADGETMIPLRDIANALGAKLVYHSSDKTVVLRGVDTMVFKIGSHKVSVNNQDTDKVWLIGVYKGRTYVPLRVILSCLEMTAKYNPATRELSLQSIQTQ